MVDLVTFCGLDDGRYPGAFRVGCDIGKVTLVREAFKKKEKKYIKC